MKKLSLVLLFALVAMPAFASLSTDTGVGRLSGPPSEEYEQEGDPVNPVPEPGTMALASMGLIALGAAARKRRAK